MIDQPLGASLDRDLTTAPGRRADKESDNFISRRDQQHGSKNLADPQLVSSLEGASDAAVRRTVREMRRELALLLPELRRLGDELKPGDDGYMTYNKALSRASQQVLALNFFLLTWNEPELQEDAVALQSLSQELFEIGGLAR